MIFAYTIRYSELYNGQLTKYRKDTKMVSLLTNEAIVLTNITLKNIPEDLYGQLKESAASNHRSINSELIACLERIFTPQLFSAQENIDSARALRERVKAKRISAQEITDAKHLERL